MVKDESWRWDDKEFGERFPALARLAEATNRLMDVKRCDGSHRWVWVWTNGLRYIARCAWCREIGYGVPSSH